MASGSCQLTQGQKFATLTYCALTLPCKEALDDQSKTLYPEKLFRAPFFQIMNYDSYFYIWIFEKVKAMKPSPFLLLLQVTAVCYQLNQCK